MSSSGSYSSYLGRLCRNLIITLHPLSICLDRASEMISEIRWLTHLSFLTVSRYAHRFVHLSNKNIRQCHGAAEKPVFSSSTCYSMSSTSPGLHDLFIHGSSGPYIRSTINQLFPGMLCSQFLPIPFGAFGRRDFYAYDAISPGMVFAFPIHCGSFVSL